MSVHTTRIALVNAESELGELMEDHLVEGEDGLAPWEWARAEELVSGMAELICLMHAQFDEFLRSQGNDPALD